MTALRERLAQMGETARAATPGPWETSFTCHGAHEERITHHVCTVEDLLSMEDVERDTPDDAAGAALVAHIATFSPDVAAALVAVADAAARSQEPTSTEAAPDADMVSLGTIIGNRWDEMSKALDALAAALGVSR